MLTVMTTRLRIVAEREWGTSEELQSGRMGYACGI